MSNTKGKIESNKDKLVGGVKETVGKVTGNEKLELKGKIQTKKGELEGKAMDIGDQADSIKEVIAGNINDAIDKNKKKQ
ncbi:CsbD family protein [Acetobacterium tundrae]|uniref:CsbD family protein n=1 Tax=Acetobacterium tundrae TaxID=132932 RepID=A0ABR6WR44_9FIRM|nr:CsbD family protein [Acetobacterium tundrae]MBC3798597.1 CsbD family protein [Acetobacterium tundrae]